MNGVVFLFPGQGSQEVGMGFDVYNSLPWAKEYFIAAQNLLGNSWLDILFKGNIEDLSKTENTQPAMLLVSTVLSEALKKKGIFPQAVAGHSVGEYAAYVASGILDFPCALKIIRKRAEFMASAVPEGYGNMAAILGLEDKLVESACERASKLGIVQPANYNCPGQVVISGQRSAVIQAGLYAQEYGAKKIIELKVSGPFHCSLMRDASDKLHKEIKNFTFKAPSCKYISNVT
ncbi:ACP S-malonyltransferase, partial [Candidatus Desantisbacteria bacterium]|nr:ACP S-malonyltransferase [Candidatus Desantisbacteria bacterium]